jgi:putative ABC transport system permease protein
MDTLIQDLRYAFRTLRRSPGFTLAATLMLALGIGANTAIFSVVRAVLLRPLPYDQPDRLAVVWENDRFSGTSREQASMPDYFDLRERSRSFTAMAAMQPRQVTLSGAGTEAERVAGAGVTQGFFPLLGLKPLAGRLFTAADDVPGGPRVAVISEALWRSRFGARPDAVGRVVRLDGEDYAVVGVAPSAGLPAEETGVWVPLQRDPSTSPRYLHDVSVLGRLAPGVTAGKAGLEVGALGRRLEAEHPRENTGRGATVQPLRDALFGEVRPALLVLLGAVALVLLVACANVANLLLARTADRGRELAVRTALGATRSRFARQFLVEGALIAAAGTGAAVLLATWALPLLLRLAPPDLPRLGTVRLDGEALAFAAGLACVVAVVFALVPLREARRADVRGALVGSAGRTATAGGARQRTQAAIVAAQVAFSVVLVVGAALLSRSFLALGGVDPGFRPAGVLKAEVALPEARYPHSSFATYPDWREVQGFYAEAARRLEAIPGVRSAAVAANHPLQPGTTNSFTIEGREAEMRSQAEVPVRPVGAGYFATVGVPLLKGRLPDARDGADAPAVLVVNRAMARRFFAGQDPVGHRIRFWGQSREIVGVVGDERFHGPGEDAPPAVYPPLAQTPMPTVSLLVRTDGDPAALAPAVRAVVHGLDPELAPFGVATLRETLDGSMARERFLTVLLAAFAATALLLAVVGLHGVVGYGVARRTREMGIRMALGASRLNVAGLVVRDGMAPALAGLLAGTLAALAGARVIRGLLFRVSATDPATFTGAVLLLAGVALMASWLPARRATRVDPMAALRAE